MAEDGTDKNLIDKRNYVLNWLSSGPDKLRTSRSFETDMEKRIDALTSALLKESDRNILRFKPRKR